jgi:hypothetical protein
MQAKSPARTRNIRRIAQRLRADDGFALPTVTLLLIAAFAVVTVGAMASIHTQRGTVRDQQTKAALQLAETGVNEAVLYYNRLTPSPTNPCSPVSSSPPGAGRWCQAPARSLNGGAYSYQVQVPPMDAQGRFVPDSNGNIELKVVGTATMGGATRRVLVDAKSLSDNPFGGDYQVKSAGDITLDSNASIHAGTATNGDITLNSNARQCGAASVGVGHRLVTPGSGSGGYYTDGDCQSRGTTYGQEDLTLPPVGQVPTTTNNDRFFSLDPVSGNSGNACWNMLKADGHAGTCGPRQLDIKSNTSVTLGGSVYVFCKLTMNSNTSLVVSSGHKVTIYFDSPENCNYPSGVVQLDMSSNSRITSNGGGHADVQLLFRGSPTRQTILHMSSNTDLDAACEQNFVVYAPLSDIVLNSNSTYCGALAGHTIHLDSNADLRTRGDYDLSLQPPVPYYQPADFVECRSVAASSPNFDAGC